MLGSLEVRAPPISPSSVTHKVYSSSLTVPRVHPCRSVPSGRVGNAKDAVFRSNDVFRQAVALREAQDVTELEHRLGRRMDSSERARIGVAQLRHFLEQLLQRRCVLNEGEGGGQRRCVLCGSGLAMQVHAVWKWVGNAGACCGGVGWQCRCALWHGWVGMWSKPGCLAPGCITWPAAVQVEG